MKIAYMLACALALLVAGCKKDTPSAPSQPPPPGQSKTISDGSTTWRLGAVTINGTNISSSNITVGIRTNGLLK